MVQKHWRYICNNITWSWRDIAKANDIDENIEFAMKKASEGHLPFLDCIICLNEKREIIPKV